MEKKSLGSGNKFLGIIAVAVFSMALSFNLSSQKSDTQNPVRKAAVAGTFYPDNKADLEAYLDALLRQANPPKIKEPVRAIMVPHAGYIYSGSVAAYAYKTLEGRNIRTVILLGNSHRHWIDGIAVYPKGSFETPLGLVPIDEEKAQKLLAKNPKILERPDTHEFDHVLEVQLPFLQRVLKKFKIIPLLFGNDDPALSAELAEALKSILDDQTLVIASTDLSHYPPYAEATASDQKTLQAILSGQPEVLDITLKQLASEGIPHAETFLCSPSGVRTVLLLSRSSMPTTPVYLNYANSGDTAGDKNRVVGYGAVAFVAERNPTPKILPFADEQKQITVSEEKELLDIARSSVENYVLSGKTFSPENLSPGLQKKLGAFVTLKEEGQLRGCIGRFEPDAPLAQVVVQMAIAAATQDPRFPAVKKEELRNLEYEISVLSPLKKIRDAGGIILGEHGVQVSKGFHHGVFLPQVADETGWSKEEFLSELCSQKAGLPRDCWKDPAVDLYVFTAQVFSEEKKDRHTDIQTSKQ